MTTTARTSRPDGQEPSRPVRTPTDRWVTLERGVAAGMLVTFTAIMAVVARAVIPPLAAGGIAFAVPLAVSARRPRGAAIAVGVVSALWLGLQSANLARVVPDLTDPTATGAFVTTTAMLVLTVAGVAGLVGLLRGAAGTAATRILQATGAAVVLAVVVGVVAGVVTDDGPTVIRGDAGTVLVRASRFQPADLQVSAGTTVTWEWADEQIPHDVVGDDFGSPVRSDGTFTHRFDTPGTYPYDCTLHPGMSGVVTVLADDADADR